MNIDLNDKLEVQNIHFSECDKTGEKLVSMLIPVQFSVKTDWEWATMNVVDFASLLVKGLAPRLCKFQHHQSVSVRVVRDLEPNNHFYIANFVAQVCQCRRVRLDREARSCGLFQAGGWL